MKSLLFLSILVFRNTGLEKDFSDHLPNTPFGPGNYEFSMKYLFGPHNADKILWTQFESGIIDSGRSIIVFTELYMIIVFTGGNYAVRSSLHKIVERFILPAID